MPENEVQATSQDLVSTTNRPPIAPLPKDIENQVIHLVLATLLSSHNLEEESRPPTYASAWGDLQRLSTKRGAFLYGFFSLMPPGFEEEDEPKEYSLREPYDVVYCDTVGWMSDMWTETINYGRM